MARIDSDELIKTATRYANSKHNQSAQKSSDEGLRLEAEMENKRRDFLGESASSFLESIVEGSDLFPMRYFAIGQLAAKAVGRIHVAIESEAVEGFATGFLVAPGIMLTNWHVLQSARWAEASTFTLDAEDRVDGLPLVPRIFQLDPTRLFVTDKALDFCFVAVHPKAIDGTLLSDYGYFRLFPGTGKILRDEFVTIIQHPNGRQKHVAARNNKVSVYVYDDLSVKHRAEDNAFLYYATDTLKGSSGSPVLSDQWYVVALHRRGVPKVKTSRGKTFIMRRNGKAAASDDPNEVIAFISNEGVRISRILARVSEIAAAEGPDSVAARTMMEALSAAAGRRTDGPLSTPTTRFAALQQQDDRARLDLGSTLEITRRKLDSFPEELGYDKSFLEGFSLALPKPSAKLKAQLAPRLDEPNKVLLPFRHFTTVMHAKRRLPVFAAINISARGKPPGGMGQRPAWSYDPRIDNDHQPDDSIFSNMLQRGHLAAREYIFWGDDKEEIRQADVHSFTLTNVCPQIARFNAHQEWYDIERQIAKAAKTEDLSITEFVGPVFSKSDPPYDDLRGTNSDAEFDTGIRLPLRFWKIVVWVEDGELMHRALLLDQSHELEAAGPLEFDVEIPDGVQETTIAKIAALTGLTFDSKLT